MGVKKIYKQNEDGELVEVFDLSETKEEKKKLWLREYEERQAKRFNFISNADDKER